jgi:hypothetical protein
MSLPHFIKGLHDQYDPQAWPRYHVRRDGVPWPDGTVYIQYHSDTNVSYHAADGRVLGNNSTALSWHTMVQYVGWARPQVSPLYILTLCDKYNRK